VQGDGGIGAGLDRIGEEQRLGTGREQEKREEREPARAMMARGREEERGV